MKRAIVDLCHGEPTGTEIVVRLPPGSQPNLVLVEQHYGPNTWAWEIGTDLIVWHEVDDEIVVPPEA